MHLHYYLRCHDTVDRVEYIDLGVFPGKVTFFKRSGRRGALLYSVIYA